MELCPLQKNADPFHPCSWGGTSQELQQSSGNSVGNPDVKAPWTLQPSLSLEC